MVSCAVRVRPPPEAIFNALQIFSVVSLCNLGAQTMYFAGTGRVVSYMVTQRYMYRVPSRKKNLRPTIDLCFNDSH